MAGTLDDVIDKVGAFGPYQKKVCVMVCLVALYSGTMIFSTVFVTAIPRHRCRLPGWENDTWEPQSVTHVAAINTWVPMTSSNHSDVIAYDHCSLYTHGEGNGSDVTACSHWVYDTSVFTSTLVSRFDLVCARKSWRSHVRLMVMIGQFLFGIVLGYTADLLGRRWTLLGSLAATFASSMLTLLSPNVYVFSVFYMILGGTALGAFAASFNVGMEVTGPSKRLHPGLNPEYTFCGGFGVAALGSYLLRDWFEFTLLVGMFGLAFLCYVWCFPESPRWLLAKGRRAEAEIIMYKMANTNGASLPVGSILHDVTEEKTSELKVWDILKWPRLRSRFLIVCSNWATVAMLYNGLSMGIGNLAGSIHANGVISAIIDMVAVALCHVLIDRVGRKRMFVAGMTLGGLFCVCTTFPILYLNKNQQWVTVTLAMLGRLGNTASFHVIYVHTSEMYPTSIRVSCMGIASTLARVGSIASPYISDLGLVIGGDLCSYLSSFSEMPGELLKVIVPQMCDILDVFLGLVIGGDLGAVLPLLIYGIAGISSGFTSILLPETLNKPLPETLQGADELFRNKPDLTTNTEEGDDSERLNVRL